MSKKKLARIVATCVIAISTIVIAVTLGPAPAPEPEPEPMLVTYDCGDRATHSVRAQGEVTDDGGEWIIRRGFQYLEGDRGGCPDIIHIANAGFEYGDPPDGWTPKGAVVRTTGQVKVGTYSAKVTNETGIEGYIRYWGPAEPSVWGARTLTFGAWVWADTPDRVRLQIHDHPDWGGTSSIYHPGDSTWHYLTVTRTLRADIDRWSLTAHTTPGTSVSAYFDGAALVENAVSNAVFEDGEFGTGAYSLVITGLKPDTSYRVRAFVANVAGISYGNTLTCKTLTA